MPYNANDPWLLPLLARIQPRPAAHLGSNNVRALEVYITGYTQAREDLGLPEFGGDDEALLEDFCSDLKRKLDSQRNLGWAGHIEVMDSSARNIMTFFREFETFLQSRGQTLGTVPGGPSSPNQSKVEPG